MNTVRVCIGLAVNGLMIFAAPAPGKAKCGMLIALSSRSDYLYQVVGRQTIFGIGLGLLRADLPTATQRLVVRQTAPELEWVLTSSALIKAALESAGIALLAAAVFIRQRSAGRIRPWCFRE